LEEERGLVEEEILRMGVVTNELERTTLLEELSWRQKLRALWLREGDRCTKFFHQVAIRKERIITFSSWWLMV
jgi:hypothetical protein